MEAIAEAPGAPPAWVLDPRADNGTMAGNNAIITAKFFVAPDPRPDSLGQTIIGADGTVPMIEMVEIHNLNDPKNSPMISVVTDMHRYKRREDGGFPEEYRAFKAGHDLESTGYPIREWIGENSRSNNLRTFNIYTVEQLAQASDSLCQTLGPGTYDLRTKAKAFIESRKGSAAAEQAAAENAILKQRLADMEKNMERLASVVDSQQAQPVEQFIEVHPAEQFPPTPERRPPGRPRLNKEN